MQASARVFIFKDMAGILTFVGGSLHGQGPLILTELSADSGGSVRSHFERLLPVRLTKQFVDTLREEAQERAREEANVRHQMKANEAKVLADKVQGGCRLEGQQHSIAGSRRTEEGRRAQGQQRGSSWTNCEQ